MNIKMIVLGCLVAGSNILYAHELIQLTVNGKKYTGELLHTRGNHVGLQDNDVCVYDLVANVIACSSGALFANPQQKESAATGTPGQFMYDNYIGTLRKNNPIPGRIGSGKRIDFCLSE